MTANLRSRGWKSSIFFSRGISVAEKRHKVFVPHTLGERVAHARRLLAVREGRDILPSELAELCGVTVNAVYAWEADTVPGPANLAKLAAVLGVTPEWIHYGVVGTPQVLPDPTLDRKVTAGERVAADRLTGKEKKSPRRRSS